MAIGNQVNSSISSLNTEIAQVAIDLHNAARHAVDFFERIDARGIQGLKDIGFTDIDAESFYDISNSMNLAGLLWFGQAALPAKSDFSTTTAKVR